MSELVGAHNRSRSLVRVLHSSCQTCWFHTSETGRREYTHCLALCHRRQSASRVDGAAFAVDVGERRGIGRRIGRNTGRCEDDGCSCFDCLHRTR